jgi:hypothetical protein
MSHFVTCTRTRPTASRYPVITARRHQMPNGGLTHPEATNAAVRRRTTAARRCGRSGMGMADGHDEMKKAREFWLYDGDFYDALADYNAKSILGLRSARRWSGWRSAWHHRSVRRPHRTGRLDQGLTDAQNVVASANLATEVLAKEVRGIRLVVQATLAETPLLLAKGSRFSLTAPRTIGFIEKRLTIYG